MFMENKQTGCEDFKSWVGKLKLLIIQGVIINIPAALVYYENVDTYI